MVSFEVVVMTELGSPRGERPGGSAMVTVVKKASVRRTIMLEICMADDGVRP